MKRNYLKNIKKSILLTLIGLTVGCSIAPPSIPISEPLMPLEPFEPAVSYEIKSTTCKDSKQEAYHKGYAAGHEATQHYENYYSNPYGYGTYDNGRNPLKLGYLRYLDERDTDYNKGYFNGYTDGKQPSYSMYPFNEALPEGNLNCGSELKEEVISEEVVEVINEKDTTEETKLLLCAQKKGIQELVCEKLD